MTPLLVWNDVVIGDLISVVEGVAGRGLLAPGGWERPFGM
jgi:hypothetical protein